MDKQSIKVEMQVYQDGRQSGHDDHDVERIIGSSRAATAAGLQQFISGAHVYESDWRVGTAETSHI